jgi:hypothetical protein
MRRFVTVPWVMAQTLNKLPVLQVVDFCSKYDVRYFRVMLPLSTPTRCAVKNGFGGKCHIPTIAQNGLERVTFWKNIWCLMHVCIEEL